MQISEVAEKFDLTTDTLRYYEREGLIGPIAKGNNGIRNYTEEDLQRIQFVKCMRSAGLEISFLKRYIKLFDAGDKTIKERREILVEQRKILKEKINAIIATVLSMKPDILIFDEPTIALDPKNRRRFINVLNSLKGTKIVTSHDLDLIYDTCDRTVLIADGKIIFDGDTKIVLQNKDVLENNGLELPLSLQRR